MQEKSTYRLVLEAVYGKPQNLRAIVFQKTGSKPEFVDNIFETGGAIAHLEPDDFLFDVLKNNGYDFSKETFQAAMCDLWARGPAVA